MGRATWSLCYTCRPTLEGYYRDREHEMSQNFYRKSSDIFDTVIYNSPYYTIKYINKLGFWHWGTWETFSRTYYLWSRQLCSCSSGLGQKLEMILFQTLLLVCAPSQPVHQIHLYTCPKQPLPLDLWPSACGHWGIEGNHIQEEDYGSNSRGWRRHRTHLLACRKSPGAYQALPRCCHSKTQSPWAEGCPGLHSLACVPWEPRIGGSPAAPVA